MAKIVSQCRGLRLAIKIVGGVMVGQRRKCRKMGSIIKASKTREEMATHNKDKVVFSTWFFPCFQRTPKFLCIK